DALEFARAQHEQIARHLWRGREADTLLFLRERLLLRHRHVADREKFLRHGHGERKRRLEGGLVPARENPPRVRGLELGRDHPLLASLRRIIDKEQSATE